MGKKREGNVVGYMRKVERLENSVKALIKLANVRFASCTTYGKRGHLLNTRIRDALVCRRRGECVYSESVKRLPRVCRGLKPLFPPFLVSERTKFNKINSSVEYNFIS